MSTPKPQSIRLDRLLANLGYGSRRDVQMMVRGAEVTMDGAPIEAADMKVALTAGLADRLAVRGVKLDPLPGLVVLLNKPLGVTCSHKDEGPLVYELLPQRWRSREPTLSTVGRLDKDTSGLLLLTDDGALLHQIISPRRKVTKRYHATLARPLDGTERRAFASGALLLEGDDKPVMPAVLEPLSDTTAWLTVIEGRYHLVRRMFAAVGNHVEALHRDRIGGLDLPADLEAGRFRAITGLELAQIFSESA